MAEEQINQTSEKPAKKKKPLFKSACIVLILILLFFIVRLINLLFIATPTISIDYIDEYNKVTQPDNYDPNENSAQYYKKAFESFWQLSSSTKLSTYSCSEDINEIESIRKWLSLNSKTLIYLEQATSKPYYWVRRDSPLVSPGLSECIFSIPYLSDFRKISYLLDSQIKVLVSQDELDKALEKIIQLYKIGAHLCGPKTSTEQLIGILLKEMSINNAFSILDRKNLDETTLKSWQQILEKQIYISRKDIDFTGNRFFVYYIIQRIFTDNGRGNGRLIPRKADRFIERPIIITLSPSETDLEKLYRNDYLEFILLALFGPDRKETKQIVDKYFTYIETLKNQTTWQLKFNNIKSDVDISKILKWNFIEEIVPVAYCVMERYHRLNATESALITTIALLKYKSDKGHFPENLNMLKSSGYLAELPMDPYSDKTLVYKRIEDSFTLYSLGANFDDDGGIYSDWGEWTEDGDQVFWPLESQQKNPKENATK